MGRPRSNNPKSEHIGISTTKEKYARFKRLGLVNDEVIDVLLFHLEKENQKLQVDKIFTIKRIKEIDKQIQKLEFERLALETELEEIDKLIGLDEDTCLGVDVEKAVATILQRFNNQSVYNILEFLTNNQELVRNQAFLCGLSSGELEDIVFSRAE